MAAKLLHTLADENSDLQKKIGCMNGIFQLFDRHHVLTNRRKSLTLGLKGNINFERDSALQIQDSNIINIGNETSEKLRRVSTESSRVSFSSSCSSSSPLSSDPNKETQPEISPYDHRVIFQESPAMSQGSGLGLDLRDVVRDSMYREARGLSEVSRHNKRRDDSPRPPYGLKQSTPVDFNESCKALAKLNTSQYYYNEVDLKDASRYYVDSHKRSKSKKKVKESPKLSLESRDHLGLKSGNNNKLVESFSRSSSVNKRPPSVVAKLMGLETLPGSPLRRDKLNSDPFSRSLRENSMNRTIRLSPSSPRSLGKDLASSSSPRWRRSEFVIKPLSSLRFPIEPAPWKKQQKQACRPLLKDLEFKHSVKDLRAINEIVEAMQTKSVKQQECSTSSRGLESHVMPSSTMRGGPIVIMKPARLVGVPSPSLIPIHSLNREEGSVNVKRNLRSSQVTTKSASPRLSHMKKHENEKYSRPPPIPSDSSKSRRQTNRKLEESATSPGGSRRSRQGSQRRLMQQKDGQAGGGKSSSVIETAKTVVSNLMQNASQKSSGDGSSEHPSPVSVLNASIYRDIKPSQASEGTKTDEEDEWNPAYSFSKTTTTLSPEVNRKKLQNVEHLVQKLKRLNSSHDEASQDYVASLCENSDMEMRSEKWTEFDDVVPGIVLHLERLLFKDLACLLVLQQLHEVDVPTK
ncbi:hypothetical protein Bca4012_096475 [Brassica carinata]